MTSKDNLEEKLHELSQAIGSDDKLVENVMNRIHSAPACGAAGAGCIRKIIMKHSLTKLATAAAIIIVALISIYYFNGSIDVTSNVYAKMVEALHNINTVHVTGWRTRIQPRHTSVGDKPYGTSKRYPIELWEWFTEDGAYRMYERKGPITTWQGEDRRYEYQADKDTLYIDPYKPPVQLSEKFQYLKTTIESEQTYKIKSLGIRIIDGREAQGYQGERRNSRKEIWMDTQTNLLLENNAYILTDGRWEQYWHRMVSYDQIVPDHILGYVPPDAGNVQYSWDIDPRFKEYHAQLRQIELYYQTHPLPETMELFPRNTNRQLRNAYGPGRLSGITDTTGYWVLPLESTLEDFLRSRIKPYGSLRVPEELQKIPLNSDLITKNEHSSRERVDFVLDALGLEIVEVREQRKVWVAHYDGRPLKPWREVKAPVARGDARHMKPGMDFNSNPHSMRHLLESFAYYQDYDLTAKQTIIIDETGLPSESVESPFDESIAVSSASPYWHGDKIIETARQWFKEQFGVTFIEETRLMTVYVVRKREQM